MPERVAIPFDRFKPNIFEAFDRSLLLTAGTNAPGHFNTMTIGWGAVGVMWKKPMVLVAVRPSRHTYEFMEKRESFTVCAFTPQYKKALALLGAKSGRDGDKISEAGLTAIPSSKIDAPGFAEAELILECRQSYFDDLVPENCPAYAVQQFYVGGNYHRIYFGEIMAIYGDPAYQD